MRPASLGLLHRFLAGHDDSLRMNQQSARNFSIVALVESLIEALIEEANAGCCW
jgi:hypothetical protein